jgi:hypothetical protein
MKPENSFAVSRFKNRNGVFSWQVDGRIKGVSIRRNFKTPEGVAAERSKLEIVAEPVGRARVRKSEPGLCRSRPR